ncbi:MAG: amidophosphoribosyltransferase [Candidatus Hecatellales archaeon]|nr:MAG: amidophosphoribosyltransferase [Candidatus Hecatellales archaeon]
MGGVVGVYGFSKEWRMARFIYYSLLALQHRGQENCGIVTFNGETLNYYKGSGFVDQVFSKPETLEKLQGWIGIGSVSSISQENPEKIQPVIVWEPIPIALCYDGKILNFRELAEKEGINCEDEAEFLARLFSVELEKTGKPMEAIASFMGKVKGAYSLIALTGRGEMVVARDRCGVKPLTIGSFGFDYGVVASESCVMDVIGADFKNDIQPGEAYIFDEHSIERRQVLKPNPRFCAFEYVYYARPDSIINGKSIYEVRMKIGEELAKEHRVNGGEVVLGVPETAIPFAVAYSNKTRTPLGIGFVQTGRRVRSAIKPTEFERIVGVQLKLNPIRAAIAGKKVVLVDDSVVRGTTTKNTVNLMRNKMGAKEVHVRIGSPRLIAQCPFGTDVPPKDELIAVHLNAEEVSKVVGADTFHWLSLKGLVRSIGIPRKNLCLGCFTGKYPVLAG